jgi:hypothetical protein
MKQTKKGERNMRFAAICRAWGKHTGAIHQYSEPQVGDSDAAILRKQLKYCQNVARQTKPASDTYNGIKAQLYNSCMKFIADFEAVENS